MTFPVGLTPSENYKAVISNHFNQKYSIDVTADSGGAITVPYASFPEGFFNPYAGFYVLEVTDMENLPQTLIVGYTSYDCVSFDIYQFTEL